MSKVALFIRHKTLPGKRDAVREIWMRHMQPGIARNPAHEAYFYCFDNDNPDIIRAFQQYADLESAQRFVRTQGFAAYLKEIGLLLSETPEVSFATPVWVRR